MICVLGGVWPLMVEGSLSPMDEGEQEEQQGEVMAGRGQ